MAATGFEAATEYLANLLKKRQLLLFRKVFTCSKHSQLLPDSTSPKVFIYIYIYIAF